MNINELQYSNGLGARVFRAESSRAAMQQADLDWHVEKRPVFVSMSDGSTENIKAINALVRTADKKVLGTVGKNYKLFQNGEVFGFFDSLVARNFAEYHSAGSFRDGEVIWLLCRFPGEIVIGHDSEVCKSQKVYKNVLLTTSHDGEHTIRIRCMPGREDGLKLNFSLSSAKEDFSLRHNAAVEKELSRGVEAIKSIIEYYEDLSRYLRWTATHDFSYTRMQQYLEMVFPPARFSDTRNRTNKARILDLYENESIANTAWAAIGAVCRYADEYFIIRNETKERRLESIWFSYGAAYRFKQHAFSVLEKLLAAKYQYSISTSEGFK